MNSLDTQVIVLGSVIGSGANNFLNVCLMLYMSDVAKTLYYGNFCSSLIGVEEPSGSIPGEYRLHQNYPNPFNPVTKIRFDVPKSSIVRLTIYNSLGAEVVRIVNNAFKAGSYEVEWNGSDFASGVYLIKFESGGFVETKKMLLIK